MFNIHHTNIFGKNGGMLGNCQTNVGSGTHKNKENGAISRQHKKIVRYARSETKIKKSNWWKMGKSEK